MSFFKRLEKIFELLEGGGYESPKDPLEAMTLLGLVISGSENSTWGGVLCMGPEIRRIYPTGAKAIKGTVLGHPNIYLLRSVKNLIFIQENGAIQIYDLPERLDTSVSYQLDYRLTKDKATSVSEDQLILNLPGANGKYMDWTPETTSEA